MRAYPSLTKNRRSIPRANGSHMALKEPISLKHRARAALRASPSLKKNIKSILKANGSHMALKWSRSLKYRARAQR
jgi:hypothetical protein